MLGAGGGGRVVRDSQVVSVDKWKRHIPFSPFYPFGADVPQLLLKRQ